MPSDTSFMNRHGRLIALLVLFFFSAGLFVAVKYRDELSALQEVEMGPATAPFSTGETVGDSGHVLVKFKNPSNRAGVADDSDLSAEQTLKGLSVYRYRVNSAKKTTDVAARLKRHPNVEFIEPDFLLSPSAIPNDPYYLQQYASLPLGWMSGLDQVGCANTATVAFADTGLRTTHADLQGKIDLTYNMLDGTTNTVEEFPHGTAVVGAATASANNSTAVASLCPGGRIHFYDVSNSTSGYAKVSTLAESVVLANTNGAKVISVSFDVSLSLTFLDAAKTIDANVTGPIVVVGAGNSGVDKGQVGNSPHVVVTGGVDKGLNHASFSNTGSHVDFALPAVNIYSLSGASDTGVANATGTSLAAPYFAAVAGFLKSEHPIRSSGEIISALTSTAADLGVSGWDSSYGFGIPNVAKANLALGGSLAVSPDPTGSVLAPKTGDTFDKQVSVSTQTVNAVGATFDFYAIASGQHFTYASLKASPGLSGLNLPNGQYRLTTTIYNDQGKLNTLPAVQIEVAKPQVTFVNPLDGATVSVGDIAAQVKVAPSSSTQAPISTVSLSKPTSASCSVSASDSTIYNCPVTITATGKVYFTAIVVDTNGANNSTSVTVTVPTTVTPSPTPSPTPTPTPTPTVTPTPSPTPTPTPTVSPSPTPTPSPTQLIEQTPSPSPTPKPKGRKRFIEDPIGWLIEFFGG